MCYLPDTDATEAQRAALARIEAYVAAQPVARRAWARAQVQRWAWQALARRLLAARAARQ